MVYIWQDECSSRMRNLEIAVRKTVPRLRRFLALLGQGAGVCEARARGGLNVCCVQRDTHLDSPANILPYLKTILADKTSGSKFMAVGDFTRRSNKEGNQKCSCPRCFAMLVFCFKYVVLSWNWQWKDFYSLFVCLRTIELTWNPESRVNISLLLLSGPLTLGHDTCYFFRAL